MTNHEVSTDRIGQPVAGEFVVPALPEWFHEPGTDNAHRPWQHTPLEPYSADVRPHQLELRETFERLAITPPGQFQGRGLERLVSLDFESGMSNREVHSAANYSDWKLNHADELAALESYPDTAWILGEGRTGHGTARGQLEILRRAPSLRSLDLQVLSTPFGYRRQHYDAMRQELNTALTESGAYIYDQPKFVRNHPPKIAADPLRNFNTAQEGQGALVTYKRKVARVPDLSQSGRWISVLERQAWLVPTDAQSGFAEDIAEIMWNNPKWQVEMPAFAEMATDYVLGRLASSVTSIPLSVMTYACRRTARPPAKSVAVSHNYEDN